VLSNGRVVGPTGSGSGGEQHERATRWFLSVNIMAEEILFMAARVGMCSMKPPVAIFAVKHWFPGMTISRPPSM
jgi:hypothetical protein